MWLSLALGLTAFISVVTAVPIVTTAKHDTDGKHLPVVDLGYSKYQGTALQQVNQYLGMRFAAPPLGDLRWRAPRDPPKTTDVQNATAFGPLCLGINSAFPNSAQSEDCLFINVWTPSKATPRSKLPVWVYIQGGGYNANSNANYNATEIIDNSGGNVVFVNFNYRVASWGFLASEDVRRDGDLNAGLLDQRKVLEWVQKYISKFGGDPDHVVIHGVSAGAGSVTLQLTAFGGRDDHLFVGAIGESVFFPTQPRVHELEFQYEHYLSAVGCSNATLAAANSTSKPPSTMACLRSLSTTVLQAANRGVAYPGRVGTPLFPFTPTIDGDFIRDYPYRLLAAGRFVHVPILFGDDSNEGSNFAANAATAADVASFFTDNYPQLSANDTNAINTLYPLTDPLPRHNPFYPSASAAYGDTTFTCPGNFISTIFSHAVCGSTVWNYRYNVLDPSNVAAGIGVPHTFETAAIFGPGLAGGNGVGNSYTTTNAGIVPIVMNYFTSFVRKLDPNVFRFKGAPTWENWGNDQRRIVLQTNQTAMETVPDEQKARCQFWWGIGAKLEQ